jgi:hypothetical protein
MGMLIAKMPWNRRSGSSCDMDEVVKALAEAS